MSVTLVLLTSLVLQIAAALAALRLIRVTGGKWAWTLIALAVGLMAVRRGVTTYHVFTIGETYAPDLTAEVVAAAISALMLAGLLLVGPVLRTFQKSERARGEAQARFRHLAETTREGVVIHEDGRIVECNRAFADLMGYAVDEVVGMPVASFVALESWDLVEDRIRAQYDQPYEHLARRKDGSTFPAEACGKTSLIGTRQFRVTTIRDVSEQKRIEDSLRDSERTLATLMDNLPGMAYRCRNDPEWTMEFVSSGCRSLTGYEVAELTGNEQLSFGSIIVPEDRQPVWEQVQRCLDDRIPFQLNYRINTKQGAIKWVWEQGVGVFSEEGELLALEGFIADVSERVRAENVLRDAHQEMERAVRERTADLERAKTNVESEMIERSRVTQALKESEARFRRLCASAPIGIFQTDPSGATIYVNDRLMDIADMTRDQALGWGWLERVHKDDQATVTRTAQEAARTGRPFDGEFRIVRGDGAVRWVHARNVRIDDEKGRFIGKVGTVEDITTRKQMVLALGESEQRLQGILDNSPAVIYAKDRDGRYQLINHRFEVLFNVRRDDLIGQTDFDLFPREVAESLQQNDRLVLDSARPVECEEIVPHDSEPRTYISLKFPLFDAAGAAYAVCGISTDITDRKRVAEMTQLAKEKAEAASRAKSVFLANVSHELRTPIMAMMGAADLIDQTKSDTFFQRRDVILRNARHLLALVDRILDLARVDADRIGMVVAGCYLQEILADACAVAVPDPARSEVSFKLLYETDIPSIVQTDATRLKQALINLISNAFKFTQEGYVHVRVRVDQTSQRMVLKAIVEDTGPGIPTESQERVFAAFTQLDPRPGAAVEGVGLGLPLAREFARRLGGDVTVESVPGEGCCFTLTVDAGPVQDVTWIPAPAIDQTAQTKRDTERPPAHLLSGRVLLAEDFADTCDLIEAALLQAGADVVAVSDGCGAVEQAARQSFDLILLDVRMPNMDGLEAARRIRASGCMAPLIALTACATSQEQDEILSAGFDEAWAKPIRLTDLIQASAAYLTGPPITPERQSPYRSDDHAKSEVTETLSSQIAAAQAEYGRALPDRVVRLRSCVQSGRLDEAETILHQMIGSAGIHGFMEVSAEAARLQEQLRNGGIEDDQAFEHLECLSRNITRSLPSGE